MAEEKDIGKERTQGVRKKSPLGGKDRAKKGKGKKGRGKQQQWWSDQEDANKWKDSKDANAEKKA